MLADIVLLCWPANDTQSRPRQTRAASKSCELCELATLECQVLSIGGEILKLLTSHNIALGSSASEKGEAYQVSACSQENIQYPYSFHLMLIA